MIEDLDFADQLSSPTRRTITDLYGQCLAEHGHPGDALVALCEEVGIGMANGEAWAAEFLRAACDHQVTAIQEAATMAEQVGGDPAVAVAALPNVSPGMATLVLGLRTQ